MTTPMIVAAVVTNWKFSDKIGLEIEIEIKKLEGLRVKILTMVIEKYMLTIGVRSVGGRPDITFEIIYF